MKHKTLSLNDFTVLTLNIQSINAKFNNLFPVINNLAASGSYFGAICLQETWLDEKCDLSLLQIPGYKLIHQGKKCSKHGGLIIYLDSKYLYKLRNLYSSSDIWEGLFIDVTGPGLSGPITIGNIYRPPRGNNNNSSIQSFLTEISPVIESLQNKNGLTILAGDFNINLLQINEREKFAEFFDLMCTNNFLPKVTLPTRFSARSGSLIDQIFCKTPSTDNSSFLSSIIISKISDHLPCVLSLNILKPTQKRPKFIFRRVQNAESIKNFRDELFNMNITSSLNKNLMSDPNIDYSLYENIVGACFAKHFPKKRVKVNKYNHKLSPWITTGIIKSIEFRDNLYKKLKGILPESPQYEGQKHNLKMYNRYLNHCIRCAKKDYYYNEFTKFKSDIRKTWDTLKTILNYHKTKAEFLAHFIHNGNDISGDADIAIKLNIFFH